MVSKNCQTESYSQTKSKQCDSVFLVIRLLTEEIASSELYLVVVYLFLNLFDLFVGGKVQQIRRRS